MSFPGAPHTPTVAIRRPRIVSLDVVRGFALCGILLVNLRPIAAAENAPPDPAWVGLLAQQRFYVIFALLFGVGFALRFESAGAQSGNPRLVLLRRLPALLSIGLVHRFALWGGDILTVYALVGLVVLLPSTWLPRGGVAALLVAGVYVCLLLVLLRTPLRRVLAAGFAPLGRMALTNYLSATVAVLLVVAVVGHPERWSTKAVLTIVGVVLVVQWVFSVLWLRRFRQGPLEWLWRWATWARRPALRH